LEALDEQEQMEKDERFGGSFGLFTKPFPWKPSKELEPQHFWNETVPESIRNDRDVLLARLKNLHFLCTCHLRESQDLPVFRLPRKYANDKQVVVSLVGCCSKTWDHGVLSEEMLDDEDVFRAYCNNNTWWDRIDISKFSERIRSNAELMCYAASQFRVLDVLSAFTEQLANFSPFAVALAESMRCPPRNALEYFSEDVRANPAVVLAFVRRNGECLWHVSYEHRCKREIVVAAAKQNIGTLLKYASEPGPLWTEISGDKPFLLDFIPRLDEYGWRTCRDLFGRLSRNLQEDFEIIAAAIEAFNLDFSELSSSLTDPNNKAFWEKFAPLFWEHLPERYASDITFVRNVGRFDGLPMVEAVFERFPQLHCDKETWLKIISSLLHVEDACEVLEGRAPWFIREDRDVVEAIAERGALENIPESVQLAYPELVVRAIANNSSYDDLEPSESAIAAPLWQNRDVVKAWFRAGGMWDDEFHETWQNDREIGHVIVDSNFYETWMEGKLPVTLRSDKVFMMKVVKEKPFLWTYAAGELRSDFDLAVEAIGNQKEEFSLNYVRNVDQQSFLRTVVGPKAKALFESHEGFTKAVVYGWSENAGPACHLSMLSSELGLKRLIHAFLGVPAADKAPMLRKAAEEILGGGIFEDYAYGTWDLLTSSYE
jgi:hypothetical protein